MEKKRNTPKSAPVYGTLPEGYMPLSDKPQTSRYVENLINTEMQPRDANRACASLNWKFKLQHLPIHKPKQIQRKRKFLTRKQRKQLNLLKLPKTDWDYSKLESLRTMWKQYMRQNLDLGGPLPDFTSSDWGNFATILARSELVGAEMTVVRSKVPNLVGMTGTVVLETKMTFQIVTKESKLKVIPKNTSVFAFYLDDLKFTVFGKHLMTKPNEKSVKKIKSQMHPDL